MQIRKILVAIDGSPQSIKAVKLASQIAKGLGAEITLIHVTEIYEIPTLINEAENGMSEETGQRVLGESAKIAKSEGIEVKVVLKKGHIVDQILRYTSTYKPDIIVMGGRGFSKMKGILMGSVSQSVSQHARCTVIIAR
jgi:nucleotide-binding universal stress UspA family protein